MAHSVDGAPPGRRCGAAGLAAVLEARSIAIVGASSDPRKLGSRPLALLRRHGYAGEIFPVNPGRTDINGVRAYPSIEAIGRPVDLALILTPAEQALSDVERGIAAGVRGFILYASGFAEQDAAGIRRQAALSQLAREHGIAILGPNCVGAMNADTRLCATIASVGEVMAFERGPLSFVSQSGAIGGYWLDKVLKAGLGFSKWITSGNEAGIGMADCIDYLARDPGTGVIGLYLEAVRDPVAMRRALTAAARAGKPVLALRAGRSAAGAAATASHTASLAGDSAICDAFLAQCGVAQVESLSAMVDASRLLVWGPSRPVRRPAIVSVSGGAGALVTDGVAGLGLALEPFGESVNQAIADALPRFGKADNPLDLTGMVGADPGILGKVLAAITEAGRNDLVFVFIGLMHGTAQGLVDALLATSNVPGCPLAVIWISPPTLADKALRSARLPCFEDIPQAIRALRTLNAVRHAGTDASRWPDPAPASQPARVPGQALTEAAAHRRLGLLAGIAYPQEVLAEPATGLAGCASLPPFPLVAKLQSPQVLHKTDVGGIRLALADAAAARTAVEELMSIARTLGVDCEGVLLQSMVEHDVQLILGLRWDPVFGPVLLIGQGGIEVEADRDVALLVLPVTPERIELTMRGLRMGRRLEGSRGRRPAGLHAIACGIHALCERYLERRDLVEIEINPLALRLPDDLVALDLLVRLAEPPTGHAKTTEGASDA